MLADKARRRTFLVCLALSVLVTTFSAAPSTAGETPTFDYPTFHDATGLVRNGAAATVGDVLRLTENTYWQGGSVWYSTPITPAGSFSTTFEVSLHDGSTDPADGLVFTLQASPNGTSALGRPGEGIGYGGIAPSVGIEFDTWGNAWDPNANHIAVNLNGDERTPLVLADAPFRMYGAPFRAWVDYESSARLLSVYVSQEDSKPATLVITAGFDLWFALGISEEDEPIYVGFTAATGTAFEQTDLRNWRFTYVPHPPMVIRAGHFNGVFGKSPAPPGADNRGDNCTAGFAVTRRASRYMLTASHCRNWLDKDDNVIGRAHLVDIRGPVPPGIERAPESGWVRYAERLDCGGSGHLCLFQPERSKANDVMAWRPTPGIAIPTAELETNHGVFKVLRNGDWKRGQRICQMGASTRVEKCGSILKKKAFDKGTGYVKWRYDDKKEHVMPGDSGGPVYAYVYNSGGSVRGVAALGINEAYNCNPDDLICTNYFLPIATIMQQLGVNVLRWRPVGSRPH
jgi:hypothetical protein